LGGDTGCGGEGDDNGEMRCTERRKERAEDFRCGGGCSCGTDSARLDSGGEDGIEETGVTDFEELTDDERWEGGSGHHTDDTAAGT